MAYNIAKFKPMEGSYILEFSLYPYPIGIQQTEMICWEWRLGWLHYQLQANRFLLQENNRLISAVNNLAADNQKLISENFELKDKVRMLDGAAEGVA